MGNKLFVVLHSVMHETSDQFLGVFAKEQEAREFAKKFVGKRCNAKQFELVNGDWESKAEEVVVRMVEVGEPFQE